MRELARVLEHREDLWDDGLDSRQYAVGDEPARPRDSKQARKSRTTIGRAATKATGGVNEGCVPVPARTPETMSRTKYEENWASWATPTLAAATAGSAPAFWR